MLRRLAVLVCVTTASFGALGSGSAGATITLPPGNGSAVCAVSGNVKVVRSLLNPTVSRLRITGSLSGCSFNGNPIPWTGGTTRTVAVGDPTKWCTALTQGGTIARSVTKVVVLGTVVLQVSVNLTLSPATPSGPGSALELDGTISTSAVTVRVHALVQTDRPVADLCSGATGFGFAGSVSGSWTRA